MKDLFNSLKTMQSHVLMHFLYRAQSTDAADVAVLNVTIKDVNDEKPVINGLPSVDIDEEQPRGTVIPTIFTASDADATDVLTFSISGN